MTDEEADWVLENVLDRAPDAFVAGGDCRCQGPARTCCVCWAGFHDMCEGFTFRYEGHVFNARFSWPPLADLRLAGRLCKKACACTTCYPTEEQLDLFGAAS
ncbi:hypothetical protein ACIQFW_04315 [Streptomyces ardesiacus]|uniref:hypothetical protein n=1 Tax=Streptomyces ardesiacus TaxID=285564 RepID=UPI00381EB224